MTEMLTGLGTIDVTIGVGVTAVVDGYTLGDNAALVDLGTVTDDGPFVFGYYLGDETLTVASGGVFEMVAGGTIFEPTGNSSAIFNDGLFEAAGTALSTVAVPFFNLTGGTLGSGTAGLELLEGGTIGGRLEGPGEIDLGGGGFTLFASAVGALETLAIGATGTSAVVYLDGNLTVANELELFGGGALDSIYEPQATLVNNNLLLATGSGASVIDISFTNGNTATIDSNIGALQFDDGGILAGTLGGTGEIELAGGDFLLLPNAVVNVASLVIGSVADLTLDSNFSFAGAVSFAGGALDLNGYRLDSTGPFDESGYGAFAGTGTINISGSADVNEFALYDNVTINFTGELGTFSGDFESPEAQLNIASGSTWETDGLIAGGANGNVVNSGTLLNLTAGETYITGDFTQTGGGVIDVREGTLDFNDYPAGGGTIEGALEGAGEIVLANDLLLASVVKIKTLAVGSDGTLGENLNYAGLFMLVPPVGYLLHSNFNLNGFTLDLSGDAVISKGYVLGPGRLEISGSVSAEYANVSAPVFIKGGTLNTTYSDFADGIKFDGKGELIIGSTVMPTTTISGFAAGDEIQLAGVKYHAGAKVKVKEAGVVEIIDGGATYSLNIAGATVGETDFSFGKGSVLTTSAKAKMEFLRPESSGVAAASDDVAVAPVAGAVAGGSATIAAVGGGLGRELLALVRAGMDVPVGYGNFG